MNISLPLVLSVLLLGVALPVAAQQSVELRQGETQYNRQATNGVVPVADNVPPEATGGQFRGAAMVGAGVSRVNAFSPGALPTELGGSFASLVQSQGIPAGKEGGSIKVALRSARVGFPFFGRRAALLFGSVITPPEVDEYGVPLSSINKTLNPGRDKTYTPTEYWFAQPATTNSTEVDGFYWSPHARKVFATAAGPIAVPWRKASPDTTKTNLADVGTLTLDGLDYRVFTNRYVVSGSPVTPPRQMYWTKGDYTQSGLPIQVPRSRVKVVQVAYNAEFKERVETAVPQRSVPVADATKLLSETRTLWFDSSVGVIEAYNKEGRVFLEFLGASTSDGSRLEHLGFEIVDVVREPVPFDMTAELGDRITAFPGGVPSDVELDLEPVAVQDVRTQFAYRQIRPGTERTDFFAVRETRNQNDLLIHWLEEGAAGLRWPMRLSRYALSWPESIHRYSHYLRAPAKDVAEAKTTAIPLPNENAPYLQYQDALDQPRAGLTDAFAYYTWLTPQYPAHRGLLRFTAGDYVRFERVFSWLDSGLQSKTVAGSVATNLIEVADYYEFPKRMGDYGTALTAYWTTNTSYLANRSRGVNGDWRLFVGNNAADNASVGSISAWTLEVLLTNRLTSASWTTNFTNTTLLALVPGSTAFGQYSDTSINTVTGISNEVVGIRVALLGVTNRFASEIEAFLVSPRNGACAVLSDAGGLVAAEGWNLRFADDATGTVPSPLTPSEALLPHRPTDNLPNDPLPPGTVGNRVPRLGDLLLALDLPALPTPPPAAPWPSGTNAPTVVEERAFVGRRIERPASLGDGPIAGYISTNKGTAYSVSAYKSPLAVGFSEAVKGAIIPVNARPGFDSLEVWWFRPNGLSEASRNAGFKDILWPEALGLYDLEWPTSDPPIVLASNDGSGALPSDQAEGFIYYQNDSTLPGYNPNEEHALMQGGQAYALRDDLNVTGGDSYSSAPMVLVEYTASDGRPNMRAFPVVRERPEEGETFDYRVDAGTILQPPMPLPLLETPFAPDKPGQLRVSLNEEVPSWTNATATLQGATWSLSGRQPHFFRRFDLLVLQDPTKYATGGLPRWLLVTNTSPSSLSGILSTSAPYTLSEYVGTQPGGSSFRYNVDRETSLSKNIAVHIANPDQRLAWDAQIKEINTLDGWIEILFTTSVPSAAA
ncbi:MAG: hypothetical protein JNL97_15435, partial [Verrucomicrobiales bacterium]|nr:hypothetical protein [Verrucomicrobiales bacterium]